jgi:tRNA 2-thiouridine synthesizing protein E
MRPLCKSIAAILGSEKGRSLYLNQLFPGSPAKQVALLAGLPKPKNCL